MQDEEKDDENSELFKESAGVVLHNDAAKSDSSILSAVPSVMKFLSEVGNEKCLLKERLP